VGSHGRKEGSSYLQTTPDATRWCRKVDTRLCYCRLGVFTHPSPAELILRGRRMGDGRSCKGARRAC
jgi:hypothetical protein